MKYPIKLNVSQVARELVYGSKPRIPDDKLVTYKDMRDYITQTLSMVFGQYIHGLAYGRGEQKFIKTYRSASGVTFTLVAIPDDISSSLLTEEKCTFNSHKKRDRVGENQLQLEGYVCNAKLGTLKIRRIHDNTITRHIITLEESTAVELIERYISQTMLQYFS
jgi:hypothetical protein